MGYLARGCQPTGMSAQGGVCRGVSAQEVVHTFPPDRMTDACENITFQQHCCGR